MKSHYKRIISLLLITITLMFSLASCKEIDERREHHFNYGDNDTVYHGEKVYKLFIPDKTNLIFDHYTFVYITEEDVPLLLSWRYGMTSWINKDKTIISTVDDKYYILSDIYDDYLEKSKNPVLTSYGYYNDASENKEDDPGYKLVSPEGSKLIESMLDKPDLVDDRDLYENLLNSKIRYSFSFFKCDKYLMFRARYGTDDSNFSLMYLNDIVYMVTPRKYVQEYITPEIAEKLQISEENIYNESMIIKVKSDISEKIVSHFDLGHCTFDNYLSFED